MTASWRGKTEKENEKVNEQEWENSVVSVVRYFHLIELKAALPKSQKWKLTGTDKVPIFLFLSSSHVMFYKFTGKNYAKPGKNS